jgi:hypothetical protein
LSKSKEQRLQDKLKTITQKKGGEFRATSKGTKSYFARFGAKVWTGTNEKQTHSNRRMVTKTA